MIDDLLSKLPSPHLYLTEDKKNRAFTLAVKVKPNANKDEILRESGGYLLLSVRSAREKGPRQCGSNSASFGGFGRAKARFLSQKRGKRAP